MNEEIGEFVMYQDVEQSSAVVYFKKLNILVSVALYFIQYEYKFKSNI